MLDVFRRASRLDDAVGGGDFSGRHLAERSCWVFAVVCGVCEVCEVWLPKRKVIVCFLVSLLTVTVSSIALLQ